MAIVGYDTINTVINSSANSNPYTGSVAVTDTGATQYIVVMGWTGNGGEDPTSWTVTLDGTNIQPYAVDYNFSTGVDFGIIIFEINGWASTGSKTLSVNYGVNGRACVAFHAEVTGHASIDIRCSGTLSSDTATETTTLNTNSATTNRMMHFIGILGGGYASSMSVTAGGFTGVASQTGGNAFSDLSHGKAYGTPDATPTDQIEWSWTGGDRTITAVVVLDEASTGDPTADMAGTASTSLQSNTITPASVSSSGTGATSFSGQTIITSSFDMSGTASDSMVSNTVVGASMASDGTSAVNPSGQAVAERTVDLSGLAAAAMIAATVISSTLDTTGTSTTDFIRGLDNPSFDIAGTSSTTFQSQAVVPTTTDLTGASTVSLQTQSVIPATADIAGTSAGSLIGQTISPSSVDFSGSAGDSIVARTILSTDLVASGIATVSLSPASASPTFDLEGSSSIFFEALAVVPSTLDASGTSTMTFIYTNLSTAGAVVLSGYPAGPFLIIGEPHATAITVVTGNPTLYAITGTPS